MSSSALDHAGVKYRRCETGAEREREKRGKGEGQREREREREMYTNYTYNCFTAGAFMHH